MWALRLPTPLAASEVLVVVARRTAERAALADLPPDDRTAALSLPHQARRDAFVAGRRLLRSTLATVTGLPADALRFEPDPAGRLRLVGLPEDRPGFNLSHTVDHDAVAVGLEARVGLDIEPVAPPERDAVAETFMSGSELEAYRQVAVGDRAGAFLRFWTRKEALLKAMGTGFLIDPRSVTASGADVPAAGTFDRGVVDGWSIAEFRIDGVTGAVASAAGSLSLRLLSI